MKAKTIFLAFILTVQCLQLYAKTDNPDYSCSFDGPEILLGDSFTFPLLLGTKSDDFSFSRTLNTWNYTNQYTGRSTNDVFFTFTLTVPMNVTINHDGSSVEDTYLWLLDSTGSLIESNNDYSGEGHCANTHQAFINRQLDAGTYYVVSEGNLTNGNITTCIIGNASTSFNYSSIPSSYSTSPGTGVGGMGGVFGVSSMGGATYSIPIDVPVGLHGLEPSLSITYNSQSGNGIVGYGTGISGLSCITRGPMDIYHDSSATGLTYLSTDALYLDGVRLMLVSGTSGLPNSVYSPESSPFTTVTVKGSYSDSNNSTWFEVHTPDGMTYYYGHDTQGENSRLSYTDQSNRTKVLSWYITKCVDPLGNYISYSYTQDGYTCYPYAIHYGGNENNSTDLDNSIMFTYTARSDVIPFKFDGKSGSISWLLSSVSCKTGNSVYRTYSMNYNTTADGTARKFSRLVSVTEKNAQNKSLPATQFGWSYLPATNVSAFSLTVNTPANINPFVSFPFCNQSLLASDMNNDGLSDIIGIAPVSIPTGPSTNKNKTYVYVYEASRTSSGGVEYVSGGVYETPGSFEYGSLLNVHSYSQGLNNTFSIDFDGDGVNELLLPYHSVSGSSSSLTFMLAGEGYPIPTGKTFNLTETDMPQYSTGDINKDGRCDVIYCENNPSDSYYPFTILSYNPDYNPDSGSSSPFVSTSFSLYLPDDPESVYLSDMNGNGMLDLLVIHDDCYTVYWNCAGSNLSAIYNGSSVITVANSLMDARFLCPGDFNGDCLLDFLYNEMGSNSWYFFLNSGNGTFNNSLALTNSQISDQSFTVHDNDEVYGRIIDFDHDGLEDMIVTKAVYYEDSNWLGQTWGVFDYTVTKWLRSSGNTLSVVYTATSERSDDMNPGKYIVSDFDGDGIEELVNYGYDCVNGYNSNSDPVWRIYRNSNLTVQSGKVTSVTGDFGATTSITYSTLSDPVAYSKGNTDSYPAPRYTIPLNVVRQTVESNGAAGNMTTQYSYNGLKSHLKGRGLLGFSKVTVNNTTMGVTTENGITQWDTVRYIPKVTYSKTIVGSQTAQITNTLTIVDKQNKKYFAYPSQTMETDLDGNSVTTTRTYNTNNGYITQETVTYAIGMYRTLNYQDYVKKGGAYRPQTIIMIQKHPNDNSSFSRTTKYTYDINTGLVTQRKDNNQDTSHELTTNYIYDTWGNVLSQSCAGSGVTTCTIYYEYDHTHRFPLRTYTNLSSLVLRRTYDTWGHVLTEQDSVNTSIQNTVTYTYDDWGNLTHTEIPGNGEISYTRGWSHDPALRWFVLEQGSHRPWVKTWYDNHGREVKTESVGPDNVMQTNIISYNSMGMVSVRSTTQGNLTLSTSYTYDSRGRVLTETAPGDSVTDYSYAGPQSSGAVTNRVTVTHNGRSVTTAYNAWGGVVSVSDPSSQDITYSYKSNGQPASISVGYLAYTFGYDEVGNRTSFTDPDAGTTTYTYDALGRETGRNDGRGVAFSTTYDYFGRVTSRTAGSEQITYTYGTSGTGAMRLTQETNGSMTKSYEYDSYGRCTKVTHMGNNTTYSYTTDGLLSSVTHPGNKTDSYTYDSYGNVSGMSAVSGAMTWSRTGYTGTSSTSSLALQNGSYPFVRTTSLDSNGMLSAMSLTRNSATLRSETYTFSPVTGNLTSRTVDNTTESFTYDIMDRLKKVQTGNQTTLEMTYNANGNIAFKTGIGYYEYSNSSKPHAVVAVDNTAGIIPEHTQSVTYNAWGKVSEITSVIGGDTYKYTITYGPDLERWFTYYKKNGVIQYYTYYGVGYENCYHQEPGATAYALRTYYVDTPDGLSGIVRYDNRTSAYTPYAVETDHLGSITALYNSSGTKVMGASFDAWGKRTQTTSTLEFRRGFTGHEHIDGFDLINMNGRVYDPLIGRFLSPDMYVQLPSFSQSFNRYSYSLNNPLKYTDPDGESIIGAVVAGAIIGTYMGGVLANEGEKNPFDWDYKSLDTWCYMACGLYVGAMSGAVGGYIASSGIPMANTASMVASSLVNSVGTWGYTGGATDISINYGFGSYNFTQNSWGWLGKEGNSKLENVGYALGAIGNISDLLIGFEGESVQLNTEHSDCIGHSALTKVGENDIFKSYVSVGPDPGGKWIFNPFKFKNGTNNWSNHVTDNDVFKTVVDNVNVRTIEKYGAMLNKYGVKYNLYFNSCVNNTARALTLSGVPCIGIHPFILHAQMVLRSYGFRPALQSYLLTQY